MDPILSSSPCAPSRIAMISIHGYVAAHPPLGAADTGGQVVYVLELSRKMAALGFEVDIWTRRFNDQPAFEHVSDRVRIIRVACGGGDFVRKEDMWRHLGEWAESALQQIARLSLTYAFVNTHYWDAGIAGDLLCATLGVPHVHTPHSLGLWKQRQMERDYPRGHPAFESQYNFARRVLEERRVFGECDLIVATSQQQADLLSADYDVPSDKIQLLPPGYDDSRFYPVSEPSRQAIRRRLGYSGKVILALGRLARNKGYDLLIEAFAVVASREPDAVLHLAVGGSEMTTRELTMLAELRMIAESTGYSDRVHFRTFIPDHELADHYRAADQFVLCSRYEPFGMTAIEAMASGTPTVVTVHGGLYHALCFGRHALFADPFDREDLGITMLKIFRHPNLCSRLARMGAHRARSLFTWTGVAQQLLAVVQQRPSPALVLEEDD